MQTFNALGIPATSHPQRRLVLLISTVMLAAFSRHGSEEKARRPFMLHVDEFPSFTTQAFASLLPESRKYGLGLTLLHQHISQVDRPIFDAVLGNAGTMIAFRVGAQDAPEISRQLGDVLPIDLVRIPNHRAYVQLMIDGEKSRPFSMQTWPPPIALREARPPSDEPSPA